MTTTGFELCKRGSVGPSRRSLLRGAAASLAALAWARSSGARAIGRLAAGDGELVMVSDGHLTLPMGFAFPDAPRDELERLLVERGMATDTLTPDCNVTLLRRGDRLAVFDVGAGPNFMPTAGDLVENLAEVGIDPQDVTDVIFTHAHPDHIWGVTDDFDELVFPNAEYLIGQAEWDFWSSPDAAAQLPEDRQTFVVGAQNRFAAIEDRIAFFKPGAELFPGVEAVDTAGHTPGHMAFVVHGGDAPVLIAGDALTNAAISFAHPEWPTASDQDPDLGIRTRLALLARLADERVRLIGYHLPHPGAGMVERDGTAYRFVPA